MMSNAAIIRNPVMMTIFVIATGFLSTSYPEAFSKWKKVKTALQDSILKDGDGNKYTLKIMPDDNLWITANLNANIPNSYCYEDMATNGERYGRLYTWESGQKGCALLGEAWRLPTDDEWRKLVSYYGGVREDSDDNGATAYKALLGGGYAGFNAVLGGSRDLDGSYARREGHGLYWTATESDNDKAWFYNFGRGSQILNRDGEKTRAFSVRCVKDVSLSISTSLYGINDPSNDH